MPLAPATPVRRLGATPAIRATPVLLVRAILAIHAQLVPAIPVIRVQQALATHATLVPQARATRATHVRLVDAISVTLAQRPPGACAANALCREWVGVSRANHVQRPTVTLSRIHI